MVQLGSVISLFKEYGENKTSLEFPFGLVVGVVGSKFSVEIRKMLGRIPISSYKWLGISLLATGE